MGKTRKGTGAWLKERGPLTARLVMPYFVVPGEKQMRPVRQMPGIHRLSIDCLVKELDGALKAGIRAVMLFECRSAGNEKDLLAGETLLARCIKAIKGRFPQLTVISDLCVCSRTRSGHCRLTRGNKLDQNYTARVLADLAVRYGINGADIISPSPMIKGLTKAIRTKLDGNGLQRVALMPVVKFDSCLYLPARTVLSRKEELLDRKPYFLPVNDRHAALQWCLAETAAGADILMIKPAHNSLDILRELHGRLPIPLAGFLPSGHYALIKHGYSRCGLSEKDLVLEELHTIIRAGGAKIVTYHATAIGCWLNG